MPVSGLSSSRAFQYSASANPTPAVSSPAPTTASFPLLEHACYSNQPLLVCHPLWPEGKYISISPAWLHALFEKMTPDEKQGMEDILPALEKGKDVKDVKKHQGYVEFKLPKIGNHVAFSYEDGYVTYLGAKAAQPDDKNDFFVEEGMRIDTNRIMERINRTASHSPPPSAAVMQMMNRRKGKENAQPSPLSNAGESREDVESNFPHLTKEEVKQRNEYICYCFENQMMKDAGVQEVRKLSLALRNSITHSRPFSKWAGEQDWSLDFILLSSKGRKDAVKAYVQFKHPLTTDKGRNKEIEKVRRNLEFDLIRFVTYLNAQYPNASLPYASSRKEARRFARLGEDELKRRKAVFHTAADNNEKVWEDFRDQFLTDDIQKVTDLAPSKRDWISFSRAFCEWATEEDWPLDLISLSPQARKAAIEARLEYKYPWSTEQGKNKDIARNRSRLRSQLIHFEAFLNQQYPDAFLPYASNWEEAFDFAGLGEDQLKQWAADFNTAFSNNKESSLAFEKQVLEDAKVERLQDLTGIRSSWIYTSRSFSDSATEEGRVIDLSSLSPEELDEVKEAYLQRNYPSTGDSKKDKQIRKNKNVYRSNVKPFLTFLKSRLLDAERGNQSRS